MPEQQDLITQTIPPPIAGENFRDALDAMQPTDAIRLVNLVPSADAVSIRRGSRKHVTNAGNGLIESLHGHLSESGTRKLIAAGSGAIYDVTVSGSTPTKLGDGFTSNKWQAELFRHYLILVNGADQPQKFDGTTLSATNFTGIADDAVFTQACAHKNHLWFVAKNSSTLYYAGLDAIAGAVTSFDASSLVSGPIAFVQSVSYEGTGGSVDYFIIVSFEGEVVVYAGNAPEFTWVKAKTCKIATPLGRRAYRKRGSDLFILTTEGEIPLSEIFSPSGPGGLPVYTTDRIRNKIIKAGAAYREHEGWCTLTFPEGGYFFINVPISEGVQYRQYLCNLLTGAWFEYRELNGACWATKGKELFYGGAGGVVYQAEWGDDDDSESITVDCCSAFNYFGDRAGRKRFVLARPMVKTNNDLRFNVTMRVDNEDTLYTETIGITGVAGGKWDEAEWDDADWQTQDLYKSDWYSVAAEGYSGSPRFRGSYKDVDFSINAIQVGFIAGGNI